MGLSLEALGALSGLFGGANEGLQTFQKFQDDKAWREFQKEQLAKQDQWKADEIAYRDRKDREAQADRDMRLMVDGWSQGPRPGRTFMGTPLTKTLASDPESSSIDPTRMNYDERFATYGAPGQEWTLDREQTPDMLRFRAQQQLEAGRQNRFDDGTGNLANALALQGARSSADLNRTLASIAATMAGNMALLNRRGELGAFDNAGGRDQSEPTGNKALDLLMKNLESGEYTDDEAVEATARAIQSLQARLQGGGQAASAPGHTDPDPFKLLLGVTRPGTSQAAKRDPDPAGTPDDDSHTLPADTSSWFREKVSTHDTPRTWDSPLNRAQAGADGSDTSARPRKVWGADGSDTSERPRKTAAQAQARATELKAQFPNKSNAEITAIMRSEGY